MRRIPLALFAAALLLPLALQAEDVRVYKTQSADGVNQYSQIEPENGEARDVATRRGEAAPAPEETKTPEQIACERARLNVELLESDKEIALDKDGDGVGEPLSAEDRASQLDLAKRQVSAYCGG